jgi:hypothetical protein
MKKVIKTGSSLLMKIGAGSALFGATIASTVAQAQSTGQPGGVTEIAGNILGEGAAGLELFQAGAAILGAGMIVAALISWFLRSKKGAQASQDTMWWPAAMGIGILLIYSTFFTDTLGQSILGEGGTSTQVESFQDFTDGTGT